MSRNPRSSSSSSVRLTSIRPINPFDDVSASRFEWSYVSVVYTDSEYGDHGYETLASFASEYSICFSAPHRISEDRFTDDDYDNVVRTIAEKTDVRGTYREP